MWAAEMVEDGQYCLAIADGGENQGYLDAMDWALKMVEITCRFFCHFLSRGKCGGPERTSLIPN